MNMLFGLVLGLVSASAFWILCWLIPEKVWATLPPEYLEWKSPAIKFIGGSILIIVTWNALMTYGPRNQLNSASGGYYPERSQVQETKDIFESKDRGSEFSKRVEVEDVAEIK